MPPRWNTWALVQAVQLDYENAPKERAVRLAAPAASVGDPVRVGVSGAEIEGQITRMVGPVLHVKVKAAPLKVRRAKRSKTA